MPYEDVYLMTSDHVKLHAYVIPARKQLSAPSGKELNAMSPADRKARFEQDVEAWTEEIAKDDVVEYVKGRPTVIIFHANAGASPTSQDQGRIDRSDLGGNLAGRRGLEMFGQCSWTGNMGHRIPLARKFNVEFKCNVFMLSYRGYGKSDGHASELGESSVHYPHSTMPISVIAADRLTAQVYGRI